MQNRIIFLGTAGDSIVVGKQYRASGGIVLQLDKSQFHLDPGPGALVMAKAYGINLRENTGVIVSHNHLNHANDANAVISAMTHNGLDKHGVLISNKTALYGNEENTPMIASFYKNCVEKTIPVEAGNKIGINNIDIFVTKAKHGDPESVGFRIVSSRATISYTSDTEYTPEVAEQYKNSDILILDCVYPSNVKEKGHLNSESAAEMIKKVKPELAVITHFGIKMLKADPIYEARQIQKKSGVHVIAAKDGMIIDTASFSSSVRQKTLKGY